MDEDFGGGLFSMHCWRLDGYLALVQRPFPGLRDPERLVAA